MDEHLIKTASAIVAAAGRNGAKLTDPVTAGSAPDPAVAASTGTSASVTLTPASTCVVATTIPAVPTVSAPLPLLVSNPGADEDFDPRGLQPANWEHLQDRYAASQADSDVRHSHKRDREPPAPRTRESLLSTQVWKVEDYRDFLRRARQHDRCVPTPDACPIVLAHAIALELETNELEFKLWLQHCGYL